MCDSYEGSEQRIGKWLYNFLFRFYSYNFSFVYGGVEKFGEEQLLVVGQVVSS